MRRRFDSLIALVLALALALRCPAALAEADGWVCPNCGQESSGNFCGNCGAKRIAAHTAGIAVDADAALGIQQTVDALVQLFRRRNGRITQAEVIDLLFAKKFCLLPAVFKNLSDLIGSRAHSVCALIVHRLILSAALAAL